MADDKQSQDKQDSQQQAQQGETPATFEAWLETQDDAVKTLHETHTQGLKSALTSERESRKAAEAQLRELAGAADEGSEAKKQLSSMADQMAETDRKAGFYEDAHSAGVSNIKLAYTVAVQDEMFDRRGGVDFEAMKGQYPELFGGMPTTPAGNAGTGTQSPPAGAFDVNKSLRDAFGR